MFLKKNNLYFSIILKIKHIIYLLFNIFIILIIIINIYLNCFYNI